MDPTISDEAAIGYLVVIFVCLGLLIGLLVVYVHTRGRSGPISALVFVVCGPVLGIVLFLIDAFRILARPEQSRLARQSAWFDDFSVVAYVGMEAAFGLGASLIASLIYMYSIRHELDNW
ncbi:hypothetical protein [Lacipirellula limnantheis]|uniref:Uncharacterized protein n=1 Tax=Lacipirellula limnantheis TaxID=2528024 RepID=A0A517U243_9BACT|nr:hypothetical protein [Lacipirellula limnantheis]QDT74697.1 hypothetical protein I41_38960 [Lacipirellula limnantheis]